MKASQNVVKRVIAGETVLIPTGKLSEQIQGLMSLNETGVILWDRLSEGCTEEELCQALLDEYETTQEEVQKDIIQFLSQLKEHGLLLKD